MTEVYFTESVESMASVAHITYSQYGHNNIIQLTKYKSLPDDN